MTADRPDRPEGPRSPRTGSRGVSGSSQYARAFQSHSPLSSQDSEPLPRPQGPRSPEKSVRRDSRDAPGSSKTRYWVESAATSPSKSPRTYTTSPTRVTVDVAGLDTDGSITPYRPPEPVYEDEALPDYAEAVVAEHPVSDDEMSPPPSSPLGHKGETSAVGAWQLDVKSWSGMDFDEPKQSPERPQVGTAVLPRALLEHVHRHLLVQPTLKELPRRDSKKTLPPQSSPNDNFLSPPPSGFDTGQGDAGSSSTVLAALKPVESSEIYSMSDVLDALPGGASDYANWYFCTTCWVWLRIVAGRGDPPMPSDEEFEKAVLEQGLVQPSEINAESRAIRAQNMCRIRDVLDSRGLTEETDHHFHMATYIVPPSGEERIERISVEDKLNAFPHHDLADNEEKTRYHSYDTLPAEPPRLFVSCSSDLWLLVDKPVPGQMSANLVNSFTAEKVGNPGPGLEGPASASVAWSLILTLLQNPLFKGQRGWVRLDNPKFNKAIGMSLSVSHVLYQIGFGCRSEDDHLRVGPFVAAEGISEQDARQVDRYMIRAWVEISIFLLAYQIRNDITTHHPHLGLTLLEEKLGQSLDVGRYPTMVYTIPDSRKQDLGILGVTKHDTAATIQRAYQLQIQCDQKNLPEYLGALERLSTTAMPGRDDLQVRVATERSLGHFTLDDVRNAYDRIGYTRDHADTISVEPHESPDDYILDMHKNAMQATTSQAERGEVSRALALIGQHRHSQALIKMGESGRTAISVDEAYSALSAPRDAVDDGLILQYEMAVAEFPGKADHYRTCLQVIADAPGAERPGLKTFLQTGSREDQAPARQDIPVGLQNIGNTCYLNSILQYLYSIKPLREAVLAFDQSTSEESGRSSKPEVERARRFVRQLRLLFLQLYKSDQSSVRPDEELAYLAITRPEVDAIVQPPPARQPLDSIPDIPDISSPSSTAVATPYLTPSRENISLPSPFTTPRIADSRETVLGKRASEDREISPRASDERTRLKTEDYEHVERNDLQVELDTAPDDFEFVQESSTADEVSARASSPTAATELADLDLEASSNEHDESMAEGLLLEAPPLPNPTVPPPLPLRPAVIRKETLASGLQFGLQQDSAEVLINVLGQLELAFDPVASEEGPSSDNLISKLFSCKYHQQIVYETQDGPSEAQTPVESIFVHPIIGVEEEGKDLYDCLAELYLKGDDIEYEGKKGYMMDLMDDFPPMLYIQMRRSQFDPSTGRETKTNTHIGFAQTLIMDRFLVNAPTDKRKQSIALTREMTNVRSRLHDLRNRKPLSIPRTYQHVREGLAKMTNIPELEISQDFLAALEVEEKDATEEIKQLEERIPVLKANLDNLWADSREVEYELVSVFMHRGRTSGAGHYWTYQAHLPGDGQRFYKYNDETVTEVPAAEVLQDRTGTDANPALLCYVRKGRDLVDTLHREILELERVGATQDV
ncbi:hypothetical protein BCR39DRAFT_518545 [Naematelia encephala]|uniref:ubiquitinyl hydrolase 1 n=1 Tax=Naematelia encephala TaxID=71784 RepID=A0A1Y2BH74_9TREE|nr:hypothetical protein BCR39DRAFT_518545 [Naematelia encephala]